MRMQTRRATPDDAATIHRFIVELATYEREPDAVMATPSSLSEQLLRSTPPFECLLGEVGGEPVGMALYFENYSTWRGRPGIYLEDLYVGDRYRGNGYGAELLAQVAAIAVDRGYPRLDWQVLDWNTPSIEFYESLGAQVLREWLPCRLSDRALEAMAARAVS